MNHPIHLQLVIITALISSCARFISTPLVEELPSKKAPGCNPDIYLEGSGLPGQVRPLCNIYSYDPDVPWGRSDSQRVVNQALKLACECGADGITVAQYSGDSLRVTAFKYTQLVQQKNNISASTLHDIMQCRYRLGVWTNNQCLISPSKPGRQRLNPRN